MGPGERRRLDTNEANPKKWHYRLELVEVNKLNLPTSPCNDDPSYSFLLCVKKSVASKVRCITKWDLWWNDTTSHICTSGDQHRERHELFQELSMSESEQITDLTGCLKPCHYKKYILLGEQIFKSPNYQFDLWAVSS